MIHVEEAPAAVDRRLARRVSAKEAAERLVERVGRALEGRWLLCAALLTLLYIPWVLLEAHAHLLSNDEIYTFHIAQQPTVRQMVLLAREVDLHPPLHYALQREALHLALPRWLGSRLPSMVAGWLMTLAVFRLSSRRLGTVLGMVGALFVWVSPAMDWAWNNRPYMLWLCGLALLMLAYERATSPFRRWPSVAAVFGAGALMCASHLIGVACVLPFLVAEGARYRRERRRDGWLWAALLIPAVLGAGCFYQIRHLQENSFPIAHLPSFGMGINDYRAMVTEFFFLLSVCAVVGCYLSVRRVESPRTMHLRREEAVLVAGLIVLPALLMAVGWVLQLQYWTRYSLCAVPALALLIPWMVYRRAQNPRFFAVLLVLAMTGDVAGRMVSDSAVQGTQSAGLYQTGRQPLRLSQLDKDLPIVDANPMTFTEMSDREPKSIADRVFYLTDRDEALRYSGYTLFENEGKIHALLDLPSQTAAYRDFAGTHPRFYMVGRYDREEEWLPRQLVDSGAEVQYLGKFVSSYDDDDLYLVDMGDAAKGR